MKVRKTPWTALFPCPVVLVTCVDADGKPNIITLAWAGTVCSDPPTLGLGVRPHRYSYTLIADSREFVVNIPTTAILRETDYCGMVSGRDVAKFSATGFTPEPAEKVQPPLIQQCPVNLECVLTKKVPLGTHHLLLGEIIAVHVDETILNKQGKIDFAKAAPFVFNDDEYWSLGQKLGVYGFAKP